MRNEFISKAMVDMIACALGGSHRAMVTTAHSGEDGLRKFTEEAFDLVLIEKISDIGGLAHLSVALSDVQLAPFRERDGPCPRLIALTDDKEDDLCGHGLHGVLRQPVTLPALRHMLHRWLPRTLVEDARVADGAGIVARWPRPPHVAGPSRSQSDPRLTAPSLQSGGGRPPGARGGGAAGDGARGGGRGPLLSALESRAPAGAPTPTVSGRILQVTWPPPAIPD